MGGVLISSLHVSAILCASAVYTFTASFYRRGAEDRKDTQREIKTSTITQRNLPMIDQKKTSELIETSLVYLLSAAVAVGAFVLVWLISLLFGFGQG